MHFKNAPLYAAVAAAVVTMTQPTLAIAQDEQAQLEEVVVTGTRNLKPRTVSDSPVPVDVLNSEEFNSLGNTADITDNLKSLIPSYTATPATGDGSAFIRPTSLRGMAPDQTLVLVNGKRRHRAALVQFFAPAAGDGAHGVDIGMIPSIGLKSVEVLRDGAAAQYGSDAIAGVMNFRMKDDSEGGSVMVQYGEFFEGEQSMKIGANGGFAIGESGFLNLTGEFYENDGLSRGDQRPDAQALIDAGNQGVGSDAVFDDAPFTQSWGRPETEGYRLFFNSGFAVGEESELYFFGNYAETEGRYRFFYRSPDHSSMNKLRDEFGYDGPLNETGYTPYLDGDQTDYSIVGGWKGNWSNDLFYDFSVGWGKNELDYFLNNTTNAALGLGSDGEPVKMDFDPGDLEQEELNFNADFGKALTDNLFLGFGAEWREETYTIVAGEPDSYNGDGSSGLAGTKPQDAGEFDRDNWAIYGDLEHDITDEWLMQYALRYEDFSDFGDTTNGKIATRYRIADTFTLRGAVSTGFHAPTPGQANVRSTITTFDGATGLQVEEGLVPPDSDIAQQNGGAPLTEEKSTNYSLGFTWDFGERTTLTLDGYFVEVDDRIYRTGDIQTDSDGTISFFTNALDVEHMGLDLVLTNDMFWDDSTSTTFTLAYNHNEIEVVGQSLVDGIQPVSDAQVEDIENNYPEDRIVFTANTRFADNWWFMFRTNWWGEHYDERGTINGEPGDRSKEIGDVWYVDLELGWDITENWNVTLGGSNVFDEYPDEIKDDGVYANRVSVGLPYPRRTVTNYEGGSWYLRASYNF
ncbi:TonB-dependent receptor [Halioglobus maricola]|uniref:TonB-dependent receptor n=1 Tax=Halioglobus maricola TaxID=2601894 RepID=A0A5P9NJ76_9GAMM|nr:TonB-dependent receptor [Halioglobus maricola]QFU75629.1 TonB-dependent receptor [Halioglobus maricola]